MKKITALLLCFWMLCVCSVPAFAAETEESANTVISVTVPDTHQLSVAAEGAQVFYEGVSGEQFTVGRLSEPRLLIRAESGKVVRSVTVGGEDLTAAVYGGYLKLAPVYEDKEIVVTTEDEPTAPQNTYIVKGKVTQNGQPKAGVQLELRSTLQTCSSDQNGSFVFDNVELGYHSLTALSDGKVVGHLSFTLKEDSNSEITLQDDGSYTVSVDHSGIGVELHLVLNEEGVLVPHDAKTVQKPPSDMPSTGDTVHLTHLWLLLILSAIGIAVSKTVSRKKKMT